MGKKTFWLQLTVQLPLFSDGENKLSQSRSGYSMALLSLLLPHFSSFGWKDFALNTFIPPQSPIYQPLFSSLCAFLLRNYFRDITLYWPTLKNFFFNNSCYVFCRLKTTVLKIRAIGTNWIVWFTIRLHFLSRWWYFLSGSVFPVLISLAFWLGICLNVTERLEAHWGTSKFVLKLAPLSIYICWGLDHLSRCRGTFEK